MAVIVLYSFPPPARSGHKNRIGFLPTSLASPGLELLASALHPHNSYASKLDKVLECVWDRGVSDASARWVAGHGPLVAHGVRAKLTREGVYLDFL